MNNRRKWFEIVTVIWAMTLVVLGAIHLTAGDAEARGWVDCGASCGVYCGAVGSGCANYYTMQGCGCMVYCSNGMGAQIYCFF